MPVRHLCRLPEYPCDVCYVQNCKVAVWEYYSHDMARARLVFLVKAMCTLHSEAFVAAKAGSQRV